MTILSFRSGCFPRHPGYVVHPDDCRNKLAFAATNLQLLRQISKNQYNDKSISQKLESLTIKFFFEQNDNIVNAQKSTLLVIERDLPC